MTTLNTLPLEGIRPILSLVPLEALIKLFVTFDRRIQSLLSSTHAFAYLSLMAPNKVTKHAPYRYFVSSVRNVDRLRLEYKVQFSPNSLALLQTLNPRHLVLEPHFLHQSANALLYDLSQQPSNESLRHMARFLLPDGFPNLPLLTTRLVTLDMVSLEMPKVGWPCFVAPPTLTDLTAPLGFPFDLVMKLPPTLVSLGLCQTRHLNLESIFGRFTSLERLRIYHCKLGELSASLSFPPSLNMLEYNSNAYPPFLSHPALKASRISELLVIDTGFTDDVPPLDLQYLPTTLTSLTLYLTSLIDNNSRDNPHSSSHFPSSLTSLSIDHRILKTHILPPILTTLRLMDGNIYSQDEADQNPVSLASLAPFPAHLTSLTTKGSYITALTDVDIKSMPRTLKSLEVLSLDFEHAEAFAAHFITCVLTLADPVRLLSATAGRFLRDKFAQHWLPHMDVATFNTAVCYYYRGLRIRFTFDLSLHLESGLTPQIGQRFFDFGLPQAPTGDNRSVIYSRLESIVFPPTVGQVPLLGLPSCLKSIDGANATFSPIPTDKAWPFNGLTHLNTPAARIPYRFATHLSNMDTLKATITGIKDVQVEAFLTTGLSRKTRLNASLSLEVVVSGALLPTSGEDGAKEVTWTLLCERTENILRQRFALQMPPLDSTPTDRDPYLVEGDHIGRVVESLAFVANSKTLMLLPPSATFLNINNGSDWGIAPTPCTSAAAASTDPSPSPVDTTLSDTLLPQFPRFLVRLELHRIVFEGYIPALPESLLYMLMTFKFQAHKGNTEIDVWPSKLRVLIWGSSPGSSFSPSFSKTLPSSLQQFAFFGGSVTPYIGLSAPALDVPLLRHLYLKDWTSDNLNAVSRILPVKQLETFEVCSSIKYGSVVKGYEGSAPETAAVMEEMSLERVKKEVDARYD